MQQIKTKKFWIISTEEFVMQYCNGSQRGVFILQRKNKISEIMEKDIPKTMNICWCVIIKFVYATHK